MGYQAIENYGVIGNLRTCALVGMDGSLDWLCLPRFDSPSVFGAILDDGKGGRFRIGPGPGCGGVRHKQFYWPETNVLITRSLHADGVGEVQDFMPVGEAGGGARDQVVRRVKVVRGRMPFRVECRPGFDYARAGHKVAVSEHGVRFESKDLAIGVAASVALKEDGSGGAVGEFVLGEGECATFILRTLEEGEGPGLELGDGEAEARFRETVDYWRRWTGQCTYRGRWREQVVRSALALKLLQYEPTGAIVAAGTTSLPEGIGGVRNWDYRYTWIRDASFTVYALLRIGFDGEAIAFMRWLEERWREEAGTSGPLQLMYAVDGTAELHEEELRHLEGYRGSRPVRIGNGAYDQLQLDIYGELMDAVYLYNKYAAPVGYDAWLHLRRLVDWVCENWRRADEGVWEVRGGRREFVYSRMMCWVALDRGLRLADKRALPAPREKWLAARDEIYEEVMRRGWDAKRGAFVQAYGSDALDASCLLMPLVFFMAPNDPRMLATIDAIRRPASRGGLAADGLVYRYNWRQAKDGLVGDEGTFNMCSFWLVEALTRAGRTHPGRLEEARLLFEQMLGYANHLGLYAEQTGASGEMLGNFPQAFTHVALISAAYNLDRALDGR